MQLKASKLRQRADSFEANTSANKTHDQPLAKATLKETTITAPKICSD